MFIMKLIIAIVQDEDSSKLLSKLMQIGLSATKLATTGGFLKAGNTTLLLGIDDERLNEAISVIESVCKSRKQISTAPSALVGGMTHGEYSSFPMKIPRQMLERHQQDGSFRTDISITLVNGILLGLI